MRATTATRTESPFWLLAGVAVGLMAEATGVMLSFVGLSAAIALGAPRDAAVATLALDGVQAVSWLVAGAVAYEVARRRAAVIATAVLPPLAAFTVFVTGLVVRRAGVGGHVAVAALFWLALAVLVYAGGCLWERRLQRPTYEGEGGDVRHDEPLQ